MHIISVCLVLLVFVLLITLLIICKTNIVENYTLSKIDSSIMRYIFDTIFPPGYVIISMGNAFDPSTVSWLSHTTWEQIPDGLILTACSDNNTAEIENEDNPVVDGMLTTGKTKLTVSQIPAHNHNVTIAEGGAHDHEVTYNISFDNGTNELDTNTSSASCVVSKSTETVDTGTTTEPHSHENSYLLFNIRLGDQTSHSHKYYLPVSYAHVYYRTSSGRMTLKVDIDKDTIRDKILEEVFPKGSIILTTSKDSPSTYGDLMPGEWASLNVDALLAASYDFTGEIIDNDGSFTSTEKHILDTDELPQHTHNAVIGYYTAKHTHSVPNQVSATMDDDNMDTGGKNAYKYTSSPSGTTYTTSKSGSHTHIATVENSCGAGGTGEAEGHDHALNLPLFKVYVYQRTS